MVIENALDDHIGNPENPEANAVEGDPAVGAHLPTPHQPPANAQTIEWYVPGRCSNRFG